MPKVSRSERRTAALMPLRPGVRFGRLLIAPGEASPVPGKAMRAGATRRDGFR